MLNWNSDKENSSGLYWNCYVAKQLSTVWITYI